MGLASDRVALSHKCLRRALTKSRLATERAHHANLFFTSTVLLWFATSWKAAGVLCVVATVLVAIASRVVRDAEIARLRVDALFSDTLVEEQALMRKNYRELVESLDERSGGDTLRSMKSVRPVHLPPPPEVTDV